MRYSLKQILGEGRLWVCNHFVNKVPSHHFRLWFYKKIMRFSIAEGASIHLGCRFTNVETFSLGENSTINQYCHLDNRGYIEIGNNVSISNKCAFVTADHIVNSNSFEGRNRSIYIEAHAFIGYGAVVLGGVSIKEGVVIGAHSVVTKTTEPFKIYHGIPAKECGKRTKELNYDTKYRRLFH